jgi:hypothetical protein
MEFRTTHVLMNFLISNAIPDDFWEPVRVTLSRSEISSLKNINISEDCVICSETKSNFKQLNCCKQKMCDTCTIKWFNESVNCPYCKEDLRTYLNK